MNWRGFWQGTATALPTVKSGTELLFDIQKQPLALEAAKNKLALDRVQLAQAERLQEEMNKPYHIDYIMSMKGVDPDTNEGKAVKSWLQSNADENGYIYGFQLRGLGEKAKTLGISDAIMQARVKDAEIKWKNTNEELLAQKKKFAEATTDAEKQKISKKIEELTKQNELFHNTYVDLHHKAMGTEKTRMKELDMQREILRQMAQYERERMKQQELTKRQEQKDRAAIERKEIPTPTSGKPPTEKERIGMEAKTQAATEWNEYANSGLFKIDPDDAHGIDLLRLYKEAKDPEKKRKHELAFWDYIRNVHKSRGGLAQDVPRSFGLAKGMMGQRGGSYIRRKIGQGNEEKSEERINQLKAIFK